MKNQICPECGSKSKRIPVEIEDAKTKAISYQCDSCGNFAFEPRSVFKIIKEIKEKETPLKMKQRIIKLSKNRLGMYFNKNVIESLKLKSGKEVLVSVPSKKKVVLDIR